jgi:hypothetical protein
MLASVLHADGSDSSTPVSMQVHSVTGFAPTNDPYSVVVASEVALPDMISWACLAPENQLQALAVERQQHIEMLDDLRGQLAQADVALRKTMQERDDVVRRAEDFHTQWQASRVQLDNQRVFADNAARERDDLNSRYVDLEQKVTSLMSDKADLSRDLDASVARVQRLRRKVKRLETQSSAHNGGPAQTPRSGRWRSLAGKLRRGRGV